MTETVAQPVKKPDQPKLDLSTQIRNALYGQFEDIPGNIKCCILWESDGVTRVRANWLQAKDGFEVVTHSKFLHVSKVNDGLCVVEAGNADKYKFQHGV